MSRNHDMRLAKLEQQVAPQQLSHEEWVDILNREPAGSGGGAALDTEIEAEALTEFGSLQAAALANLAKAKKSGDPMDAFLASDLEHRAAMVSESTAV